MIIKIIGAFIAIFTFAVILETPRKYLWCAGCVGAVGWFSYLVCEQMGANEFLATFWSAFVITLVSHIFARVFKTPVTVFLIAGILPTVPGAGMYRIVYYLIGHQSDLAGYYFATTLELAGVIAIAIFLVDAGFRLVTREWKKNAIKNK